MPGLKSSIEKFQYFVRKSALMVSTCLNIGGSAQVTIDGNEMTGCNCILPMKRCDPVMEENVSLSLTPSIPSDGWGTICLSPFPAVGGLDVMLNRWHRSSSKN
jgi:hypothetical protein